MESSSATDSTNEDVPDPASDGTVGTGPFSTPVEVLELNSPFDDNEPALTPDLLELYFDSDRAGGAGGADLWYARRDTPTEPFRAPVRITELASSVDDNGPWIMEDGLRLYFGSNRAGSTGTDLYLATRQSKLDAWSAPVPITELNSTEDDRGPFVTPDDCTIFFTSKRAGNDDIFVATRPSAASPWSAPTPVRSDPSDLEAGPWMSVDGLRLYFGATNAGARDLWLATRSNPSSSFGAAANLTELNSPEQDVNPWLSPDERVVVFTSRRNGADQDLFVATR